MRYERRNLRRRTYSRKGNGSRAMYSSRRVCARRRNASSLALSTSRRSVA